MADDHDHALILDRLPSGIWRVDPGGSEVVFTARALFGLLPVHGLFERFRGELRAGPDGTTSGELRIEAASIQTRLARRDRSLRGPGYFDTARYPELTFELERLAPGGHQQLDVTGTLAVCGRQIQLHFQAQAIAHGDHLHVEGQVLVDHDLAGLGWARPGLVSKRVLAAAALTLRRA